MYILVDVLLYIVFFSEQQLNPLLALYFLLWQLLFQLLFPTPLYLQRLF